MNIILYILSKKNNVESTRIISLINIIALLVLITIFIIGINVIEVEGGHWILIFLLWLFIPIFELLTIISLIAYIMQMRSNKKNIN